MASGYVSHYTKNYDMPAKVIDNMAQNRKAYEQRMARLQQIQAEAGENKALMAQLSMIGGKGGVNAGARKMAKMAPEALQAKLAEFKEVKNVADMATLMEKEGWIDAEFKDAAITGRWNTKQYQQALIQKNHADAAAADKEKAEIAADSTKDTQRIQMHGQLLGAGYSSEEAWNMASESLKMDTELTAGGHPLETESYSDDDPNKNKAQGVKDEKAAVEGKVKNERKIKSVRDARQVVSTVSAGTAEEAIAFVNSKGYQEAIAQNPDAALEVKKIFKEPVLANQLSKLETMSTMASSIPLNDKGEVDEQSQEFGILREALGDELNFILDNREQLAGASQLSPELQTKLLSELPDVLGKTGSVFTPEGYAEKRAFAKADVDARSGAAQILNLSGSDLNISHADVNGLLKGFNSAQIAKNEHYPAVVDMLANKLAVAASKGTFTNPLNGEEIPFSYWQGTQAQRQQALNLMDSGWEGIPEKIRDQVVSRIFHANSFEQLRESTKDMANLDLQANKIKGDIDTSQGNITSAVSVAAGYDLDTNKYANADDWFETQGSQPAQQFYGDILHLTSPAVAEALGANLPPELTQWTRSSLGNYYFARPTWENKWKEDLWTWKNIKNIPASIMGKSPIKAPTFKMWGSAYDPTEMTPHHTMNMRGGHFLTESAMKVGALWGAEQRETMPQMRALIAFANNEASIAKLTDYLRQDGVVDTEEGRRLDAMLNSSWFSNLQSPQMKAAISPAGYQGRKLEHWFDPETGRISFPPPGDPDERTTGILNSLNKRASVSRRVLGQGSARTTPGGQIEMVDKRQKALSTTIAQLNNSKSPLLMNIAEGLDVALTTLTEFQAGLEQGNAVFDTLVAQTHTVADEAFWGYSLEAASNKNYITGDTWGHAGTDTSYGGVLKHHDLSANNSLGSDTYGTGGVNYSIALVEGESNLSSIKGELTSLYGAEGALIMRAMGSNVSAQEGTAQAAHLQSASRRLGLSEEDLESWDETHRDLMTLPIEEVVQLWEKATGLRLDTDERARVLDTEDSAELYKYRMSRGIIVGTIKKGLSGNPRQAIVKAEEARANEGPPLQLGK